MKNNNEGLVSSAVAGFISARHDGVSRTESISEVYDRSGYTGLCLYCAQGCHGHGVKCFSLPLFVIFHFF